MGGYNRIFLASGSPRRRQIMADAHLLFSVYDNNVDEDIVSDNPEELVLLLSRKKFNGAYQKLVCSYPNDTFTIICADTVVSIDDSILGKPKDLDTAKKMLKLLSGREHNVFTGVCVSEIVNGKINKSFEFVEKTSVTFYELSNDTIDEYIATKEPLDKAGAYAIQGIGATLVKSINGDYQNVVGLPVSRLVRVLKENDLIYPHEKCEAVVFDLDGTIMDTLDSLHYCGNYVLEQLGKMPLPRDNYKYYVGNGSEKLVERILLATGLKLEANYDKALKLYKEFFAQNKDYKVLPYPGIKETLLELKHRGIKTFVYTNKPEAEAKGILNKLLGSDMFDDIRGDRFDAKQKPNPIGVNDWAKSYNICPEKILYLGDTNTDMQTGNNAGAYTVGVSWGFRKRAELFDAGAYDVIDEPRQILNYV